MQKLASSKRVRRDFAVIRKNTAAVVNAQNKTGKGRKHCVQTEQLFLGQVTSSFCFLVFCFIKVQRRIHSRGAKFFDVRFK